MPAHLPARRRLLAASAAALLPMQRALARTRHAGGDWLEMVRAHQAMILQSLDGLLQDVDAPAPARQRSVRALAYQLGAHALAEGNAIHPVLAEHGMAEAAERLERDHLAVRACHAQLQALAAAGAPAAAWSGQLQALQAAVQQHAREAAPDGVYPKLQQKLDAHGNAALAEAYQREFTTVRGRS